MKSKTGKAVDDRKPPSFTESEVDGSHPPAYEQVAGQPLSIPPLDATRSAGPPHTSTVTADQCAVHLKLLAALADLRDSVANDDGLFGLYDSAADKFNDGANEARAKIREKRWAVYTARAVERYSQWWRTCVPTCGQRPTTTTLRDKQYNKVTMCDTKIFWSESRMPPLDILMVWHSHMLNPRSFLEDCIRYAKMSLWSTGFPWDIINNCINDNTMEYSPGESSKAIFESSTDLNWDNLDDSPAKSISCPICSTEVSVPWTSGEIYDYVHKAFENFHGFADSNFATLCPGCRITIDHERLKVGKFRADYQALVQHKHPMPGTFYSRYGIPVADVRPGEQQDSFPNRFLWAASKSMLGLPDAKISECTSVSSLRSLLESRLEDKEIMREASGGVIVPGIRRVEQRRLPARPGLIRDERIAFRRMMSHYWDNLTPFAVDLVGAVTRQGSFVMKMDEIDTLHSPTVMDTMQRLIKKYEVFMDIMVKNLRNIAVPTLDVDLAWHTHQLSPSRYFCYSLRATEAFSDRAIFIDHDDKVDENKLSDGFEWTSKMYRKVTNGGVYSECTCWYCEATRTSDLSTIITTPSRSRARDAADNLHNYVSSDPNKNPHISAHNAVQPQKTPYFDPTVREVKSMLLRSKYEKVRRRTEKRSRKHERSSNDARSNNADAFPLMWGYPVYMAYYAPYMADPCIHSDAYACNPACMSLADGAAGNCVAGTCGGAVAAGACGGVGTGACSGGPAGGACGSVGSCGGGGGGGFGGCGGGGGGGGGCGGGGGGGGC